MKIEAIVKEQYLVADGELERAIRALVSLAAEDDDIASQLIAVGARTLVNQAHALYRSEVIVDSIMRNDEERPDVISLYEKMDDARNRGGAIASERAKSINMIVKRSLMNLTFRVRGKSFVLKDADRTILEETSGWYINYGSNMMRRGRWLASIANELSEGETVASKLSEEKLQMLLDNNS